MRSIPSSNLRSFLRAAHRRGVIVRAVEQVGLCILLGCIVAAVLMPVLIWRGQSALPVAIVMVVLGAVSGLLWGIIRRPSFLQTAMEADRQLGLDDLLATAWNVVVRSQDDAWAASVVAIADARCATLSPGSLILARYGARAWGGIGLAAAIVLGVGIVSSQPLVLQAGDAEANPFRRAERAQAGPFGQPAEPTPSIVLERRHDRASDEPGGSDPDNPDAGRPVDDDPAGTASAERSENANSSGNGATGGGEARSTIPSTTRPPVPSGAASREFTGDDTGRSPGGASATAGAGTGDGGEGSAMNAAPAQPSPVSAPWRSTSWDRDRAAAMQAVENGAVPDAYRDLVRDYFDARPASSR